LALSRVTDKIKPILTRVKIRDVPPAEIKGIGWPVTGIAPMATNIFKKACKTMEKVSPADINPPKGLAE
jgi:hypothetical protein